MPIPEQVVSQLSFAPYPTELTKLQVEALCEYDDVFGYGSAGIIWLTTGCVYSTTSHQNMDQHVLEMYNMVLSEDDE